MGLFLGNNNLLALGTTGGGGGGAIPETTIFRTSGVWQVPQAVQDEVTAEGHSEIGLLMVGGGSTTTTPSNSADVRSGEVFTELRQLTIQDYDPTVITLAGTASTGDTTLNVEALTESVVGGTFQFDGGSGTLYTISSGAMGDTTITFAPGLDNTDSGLSSGGVTENVFGGAGAVARAEVTITIGASGGSTGYTSNLGGIVEFAQGTVSGTTAGFTNILGTVAISNRDQLDLSGNFPRVTGSIIIDASNARAAAGANTPTAGTPVAGSAVFTGVGDQPTITIDNGNVTATATWAAGESAYFESFRFTTSGHPGAGNLNHSVSISGGSWRIVSSGATGISYAGTNSATLPTAISAAQPVTRAREGSNADFLQFLNNPFSPDGYGGGYSKNYVTNRAGSTLLPTTPGSPGQGGYLQIFHA